MASFDEFKSGLKMLKDEAIRVRVKVGNQAFIDDFCKIERIEDCHTKDSCWTVIALRGEHKMTKSLIDIGNISGIIAEREFILLGQQGNKLLIDHTHNAFRMEKILAYR
jgi:hypothetical protein